MFYVPHEQERTNFSQNAFSQALCDHGFNFYQMFTVDLLHDFELGVWKGIFAHLIRMLHVLGEDKVQILNKRCCISSAIEL